MFDFNKMKNAVQTNMLELKSAKTMGLIFLDDFEKLLDSKLNVDLIRQIVNLPKYYKSVRILLQPYLVGKEKEVFGKKYESIQYKLFPEVLSEKLKKFANEYRLNGYIVAYHDLAWKDIENNTSILNDEPSLDLFLKAWNYLPPKSLHKSHKYEEFIENLNKYNPNKKKIVL